MRIWDVVPSCLCRQHLLGEHRELHALAAILVEKSRGRTPGYSYHPEVLRWEGYEEGLRLRHHALVVEMLRRGYRHYSELPPAFLELADAHRTRVEGATSLRSFVPPLLRVQHPLFSQTPQELDTDRYLQQLLVLEMKECGCRVRGAQQWP